MYYCSTKEKVRTGTLCDIGHVPDTVASRRKRPEGLSRVVKSGCRREVGKGEGREGRMVSLLLRFLS